MPYLKPRKVTWCELLAESSKRSGWRHAIYSPQSKRIAKAYYKGEWRNDKKEGKGIAVSSHGWMYEGDWQDDHRHGYGILSKLSENGSIFKVYAGSWVKGKKDGRGSNWYNDGSYYEGDFLKNKRCGNGRMQYKCGRYYEGSWLNNRYHGEGTLIQENGNRYEGGFVNGKKEGRGVFYHLLNCQLQDGLWKNDICVSSTIEDLDCRPSALYPTPCHISRINAQVPIHL